MKRTRPGQLAGLLMAGALSLSACGSDDNSLPGASSNSNIDCAKGDLKGAGSTFQKNFAAQLIKDYTAACSGATLDYQGIGSGAGIKQLGEGTIDFAGSDSTMKDEEQAAVDKTCGGPALHLPITAGGIAIVYNLPEVKDLQLSPATMAAIFQGTVTKWDDAKIKADNPDTTLPSISITPVHREDSSGTTDVVSKYLDKTAAGDWLLGTGKELEWPSSVQGAKGSDGVTGAVKASEGGVTYTELSFAGPGGLQPAKIKNGAGEYTAPDADSVTQALGGAELPADGNDLKSKIDFTATTAGAYPISALSYEIVCSKGKDAAKQALLKSFLTFAVTDGQTKAAGVGFAPLPANIVTRVQTAIDSLS